MSEAIKIPESAGPHRKSVLRVSEVTKSFRHGLPGRRSTVAVLRGASLEIAPGELVGLVGENGSGKSVLMKIIVGLLARDGGEVELNGGSATARRSRCYGRS